jgi:hypothetical protein
MNEELDLKQGGEGRIPERPKDWSALLAADAAASEDFMENVEDLPVQDRSFLSESADGIEESTFLEGSNRLQEKAD